MRSKSSQNAVNIINFITFLVIVIGSAALFVVLSGFAGLKTFSLSFTTSFDPDLKASPAYGKVFILSKEQEKDLSEIVEIASFSKEIEEKVVLSYDQKIDIAVIKGVDENYVRTTEIDSTVRLGNWELGPQLAVAGYGITQTLGIVPNYYRNPLKILALKPGKGSLVQKSTKDLYNVLPMVISGFYTIEESIDNKYIFAELELVQALLEKNQNQLSGINFKLNPKAQQKLVREKIKAILGDSILVLNREEMNSSLHKMLKTENIAAYLIFTLVLIIALFNVVGAIIMMILDKQENSKTLYNLGVTLKELRGIYFIQGVLVTASGGILGILFGATLIGLQLIFGIVTIGSIEYPVEFKWENFLIVFATITILGLIASKIASNRINTKLLT